MINNEYLKIIDQIKPVLVSKFPCAALQQFFEQDIYEALVANVNSIEVKEVSDKLRNNLHKAQVNANIKEILNCDEVIQFLCAVLDLPVKRVEVELFKLKHKDYTILHDEDDNTGIDFVLDFNQEWDPAHGGSVIYLDEDGEYHAISPCDNTITITRRKGNKRFIHYLNHNVKEDRVMLIGKIVV